MTGQLVLFATGMMALTAVVMNLYPVRYLHMGRLMGRHPLVMWLAILVWIGGVFTPFFGSLLLIVCGVYLLSPLYTGRIDPSVADLERRVPRTR